MEEPQELDVRRYVQLVYKRRGLVILVAVGIMSAALTTSYLMSPVYEAKAVVLIERNFVNKMIKDITMTPSIEERIKVLSLIMKSRQLLLKVVEDLDLDMARKEPGAMDQYLKYLQTKIDIKLEYNRANRRNMDAFAVSYRDRDPKRSVDFVNALIRRYIEENLGLKRAAVYGANRFLVEQIGYFKNKIDAVEELIQDIKEREGITAAEQMLALQKRLEGLLVQYTESHPEVIRAQSEMDELRAQMKRRQRQSRLTRTEIRPAGDRNSTQAENALNSAAAQDERLRTVIDRQRDTLQSLPAGPKKLSDLEREREAYKKIYEDLMAMLGKSEVSTHAEIQDKTDSFRIVDPAVLPTKPVSPDRVKIMLLGLFAGIGGAFGLVLFLDYLDDSVKNIEVLRGLGMPVLAVIPRIQNAKEVLKRRRKDILLYSATGVYLAGYLTLFLREIKG